MLEALSVCACEVNLAGMKPGDSIAVLRSGAIRLLTPDVANNSGAALCVAADIVKERVKMAPRPGVTYSFHRNQTDVMQEILGATHFTNILGTYTWKQRNLRKGTR